MSEQKDTTSQPNEKKAWWSLFVLIFTLPLYHLYSFCRGKRVILWTGIGFVLSGALLFLSRYQTWHKLPKNLFSMKGEQCHGISLEQGKDIREELSLKKVMARQSANFLQLDKDPGHERVYTDCIKWAKGRKAQGVIYIIDDTEDVLWTYWYDCSLKQSERHHTIYLFFADLDKKRGDELYLFQDGRLDRFLLRTRKGLVYKMLTKYPFRIQHIMNLSEKKRATKYYELNNSFEKTHDFEKAYYLYFIDHLELLLRNRRFWDVGIVVKLGGVAVILLLLGGFWFWKRQKEKGLVVVMGALVLGGGMVVLWSFSYTTLTGVSMTTALFGAGLCWLGSGVGLYYKI